LLEQRIAGLAIDRPRARVAAAALGTRPAMDCAFDSTINRSGARARNWSPIARIASLTRPTCALSSVSGRVRNCGACGTIAAPTMPGRLSDLLLIFFLASCDAVP